jgi:hypothetical protein
MLYDEIEAPDEITPEGLRRRYEERLAEVVREAGTDLACGATGLGAGTVEAIGSGDAADLDLTDAAAILALDDGMPDAETILAEVRNHLLLQMTNAVLNVDVIAGDLDADLSPKEIQAKIEGRHPMTLAEYATLHHYIATEADW